MEDLENHPKIRCSQIKSKLKSLEFLDAVVRDRVLERFPKDLYKIIQETKGDQWVPVEYNVTLCNCMVAELGEQGLYDWNLKTGKYSIESSIWGTSVRTAINLFKIKTTAFLKLGPYIWKISHRNCGELSVVIKSQNHHQVMISNLPQCILDCRPYLMGTGIAFVLLFDSVDIKAKVTFEQPKNTKFVIYDISWDLDKKG